METQSNHLTVHLQLIQSGISRMANNSFLLRGWSVTLVAALAATAAAAGRDQFAFFALLPGVVFWALDGFYLRQERLFRRLYDAVIAEPVSTKGTLAFSMDTSRYQGDVPPVVVTRFTPILFMFHGSVVGSIIAIIIALNLR